MKYLAIKDHQYPKEYNQSVKISTGYSETKIEEIEEYQPSQTVIFPIITSPATSSIDKFEYINSLNPDIISIEELDWLIKDAIKTKKREYKKYIKADIEEEIIDPAYLIISNCSVIDKKIIEKILDQISDGFSQIIDFSRLYIRDRANPQKSNQLNNSPEPVSKIYADMINKNRSSSIKRDR